MHPQADAVNRVFAASQVPVGTKWAQLIKLMVSREALSGIGRSEFWKKIFSSGAGRGS